MLICAIKCYILPMSGGEVDLEQVSIAHLLENINQFCKLGWYSISNTQSPALIQIIITGICRYW